MLNNQATVGLHADSNINTNLHTNAKTDASVEGKSLMGKVMDATSHLGEQVANVGKQIGDAIGNMGNKEGKLEPILNDVKVVTPNEAHDIPAHNQLEKPHWESHVHTHEVNNSGALNQGAFVGEVGNILEKESVKHGVNPSDKVHLDPHPHTHDVSNSGALNQGAFVGQVGNILEKESEKHGVNPSDKVHLDAHPHTHDVSNSGALNQGITAVGVGADASSKPHWPVHSIPTAALNEQVYAQGSVSGQQTGFIAHADHSGAHAGMFDKVGSDLIAKEQALEHKNDASAHAANLIEQGKEKLGHLGEKIGEMGDKVKAALETSNSQNVTSVNPSLSTSAHANVGL